MNDRYIPVRGKETRIAQLRRIARRYEADPEFHQFHRDRFLCATSLQETADRLSKKLGEQK